MRAIALIFVLWFCLHPQGFLADGRVWVKVNVEKATVGQDGDFIVVREAGRFVEVARFLKKDFIFYTNTPPPPKAWVLNP